MSFVDHIELTVKSGNGGNGKVSFRREKFVPKGGPDGGDGGQGGDVIIIASDKLSTFLDISNKRIFKAGHGEDGRPRKQSGKNGANCIIHVPCGTVIYNSHDNSIISDLTDNNQEIKIAKGGAGGKGNTHFSTSKSQTPRKATPGKLGNEINIRLELKIIADVGLIGYPNARKSTLLKTITQANPKIANYPFTTLHPNLGIFRRYNKEIVIADIPGIIEGAADGIGLGNQFLRHISRTNVLLFLIEPNIEAPERTINTFKTLKNELRQYDKKFLEEKKIIIAVNKMDLLSETQKEDVFKSFQNIDVLRISCFLREGIELLEQRVSEVINENNN